VFEIIRPHLYEIKETIRPVVTFLAAPEILVPMVAIGLALILKYYRVVTKPVYAISAALVTLAFFVVSLSDAHFTDIITKPDNVPIILLVATLGFFFWLCLRRAAINDERMEQDLPPLEAKYRRETVLVWPDLVMIEFICLLALSAFLILWSIELRAPLEEPASAALTPNPSKAPWYFLGLQEMLVYYDPWYAGVVLPTLIVVGLVAIPYVDTNPRGNGYYTLVERKFAITTFLYGFLVFWVTLIIIGTFLRGANWNFFGPYDHWDPHLQRPLMNVNISEIVWVGMLKTALPKHWLPREMFGILLVGAYMTLGPAILAVTVLKKQFKELGFIRFSVVAMLMLFMFSLPIKMLGRWLFNLKYIVAIPEYFINL
jgi:hypothetical protein